MGLFGKNKKKEVQEGNVNEAKNGLGEENLGAFAFNLLFEEKCEMPSQERITEVLEKRFGDLELFAYSEAIFGVAVQKYIAQFADGSMPAQVFATNCDKIENEFVDPMAKTQMWNCPDSQEILDKCKYHVIATDMLGKVLAYNERAELTMDFMEALVELYPQCKAVYFQNSGKMFTREQIVDHSIPRKDRFIYFAVNVRFFNIEGTDEQLIDTLGMSSLYLPDLQYHFKNMDPNWVVNHAYNVLTYIADNNCPFKSGDTVDGVVDGVMNRDVQWRCQFEESLVEPKRSLMDIYMNENAAGRR